LLDRFLDRDEGRKAFDFDHAGKEENPVGRYGRGSTPVLLPSAATA
jgi:hypothetical protein